MTKKLRCARYTCAFLRHVLLHENEPLEKDPVTGFNVEVVPREIEIELPDELYEMLERWAGFEGISLSELIQREVVRTGSLTNEERAARIRARAPSKVDLSAVVRDIRERRGD